MTETVAMRTKFRRIAPEQITGNVFKLIGKDWMLITAGNVESYNTMTASWGGFGVLWNKNICFCVIRPHRYTYSFVERMDHFTLSFFTPEDREKLSICGSCSGKDVNKAHAARLTPLALGTSAVYFAEARLVLECRKIYFHDITPHNFLDVDIDMHYPEKDYHRMYIGEIVSCRTR